MFAAVRKKRVLAQFKSVNERILDILVREGLTSLQVLATIDPLELTEILGITESKCLKIIEEAKDNLTFEFESLAQVLARRAKINKLSTGSKGIDALIDGGIETQSIFEIYGEFAAGKTHFMHQLAVMVMAPLSMQGLNSSIIYVDTEQTFRESKIMNFAKARNIPDEVVKNNLLHIRAETSEDQLLIIERIVNGDSEELFKKAEITKHNPLRVIIIDSMISKLRSEFSGRSNLAPRQQKLNKMLNLCLSFAIKHNGLVLITNQVTADPAAMYFGPTVKAAGGYVMSHAATYRLYVRKGRDRKRIVKVVDAPNSPTNECGVYLTGAGLVDSDEDELDLGSQSEELQQAN